MMWLLIPTHYREPGIVRYISVAFYRWHGINTSLAFELPIVIVYCEGRVMKNNITPYQM